MASRRAALMGAADTAGSFWYVGMTEGKSWDVSIDVFCRCQLSRSARGLDRFQHTNRGYVIIHIRSGVEGEFLSGEFFPRFACSHLGGKRCGRMSHRYNVNSRIEHGADIIIQRSTVRSTTSSRVERCSTCPAVETRCPWLAAVLQDRSLNSSVRSIMNTKCVEAHWN